MLAIRAQRQFTKTMHSIPNTAVLRWLTRWKITISRRHEPSLCAAAAPSRREWAWGVDADSAHRQTDLQQQAHLSTSAVAVQANKIVHEPCQAVGDEAHWDSTATDVDSDSELEHDISRDADEDSFIPLGVEARAPSPPNNEAVKAQSRAFWLLSQRTYTRHRLEQKLLSYKKFPDDAVAWAMQRVEALGYIDDVAWSRDYAKQKWKYSKWAARRIGRELSMKGIDADTVENTLEWLQTEGQQGRRSDGTVAPPAADAEEAAEIMHVVLVADARKKLVRLARYPVATRRRRISSWLARLGHDWGVAQHVLREVELL